MHKFWIILKSTEAIEGRIACKEEQFVKLFIEPQKNNIHSYWFKSTPEPETDEIVLDIDDLLKETL